MNYCSEYSLDQDLFSEEFFGEFLSFVERIDALEETVNRDTRILYTTNRNSLLLSLPATRDTSQSIVLTAHATLGEEKIRQLEFKKNHTALNHDVEENVDEIKTAHWQGIHILAAH